MNLKIENNVIRFPIFGRDRENTGITELVLTPTKPEIPIRVGAHVIFVVSEIHRETIER